MALMKKREREEMLFHFFSMTSISIVDLNLEKKKKSTKTGTRRAPPLFFFCYFFFFFFFFFSSSRLAPRVVPSGLRRRPRECPGRQLDRRRLDSFWRGRKRDAASRGGDGRRRSLARGES